MLTAEYFHQLLVRLDTNTLSNRNETGKSKVLGGYLKLSHSAQYSTVNQHIKSQKKNVINIKNRNNYLTHWELFYYILRCM